MSDFQELLREFEDNEQGPDMEDPPIEKMRVMLVDFASEGPEDQVLEIWKFVDKKRFFMKPGLGNSV
jgi:hypothetical protein